MKATGLLLAIVAAIALSAPAGAQPAAPAGATSCSGCHGRAENSAMPSLRGRSARYLTLTMEAFRTGERSATVMDRIAKGFTADETQAIADWIAAQP
jgi:cytochrome subunit of sulfide dehydrogenase